MDPGTRPNFAAIPFDVPKHKGTKAVSPQTQGQNDTVQIQHALPQGATTKNEPRERVLEQDPAAVDQIRFGLPVRESVQQRTAKQRLEFFSPPEKPALGVRPTRADAAGASTHSSEAAVRQEEPAAAIAASSSPASAAHQGASTAGPFPVLMREPVERLEQPASTDDSSREGSVGFSGLGTDGQPRPAALEETVADLPAPTSPVNGAAGMALSLGILDEAIPPAADGLFREQPEQIVPPVDGADLLSPKEPAQMDQRTPNARLTAAEEVSATPAYREPAQVASGVNDSFLATASLPVAVCGESSTPEDASQTVVESPASPATGDLSDWQSGPSIGQADAPEMEAAGEQQTESADSVLVPLEPESRDLEPDEVRSPAHQGSDLPAIHERGGAPDAEGSQTGEQSAGSTHPADHSGAQHSLGQPSEGDSGPDGGPGTGRTEEPASSGAQVPPVLPEEGSAGSSSISGAGNFQAVPAPIVAEQQDPTAQPDDQQAAEAGAEADEQLSVPATAAEAGSAFEAAAEAPRTARNPLPTDGPMVKLPSLPVPPPVAPFQRKPFLPPSEAPISAPHVTAAPGLEAVSMKQTARQPDAEKPVLTPDAVGEGPVEAAGESGDEEVEPDNDATDADLLALAEEVKRLEQELASAQGAVERMAGQADAARAEAQSASAEAAEWRECEADARAELVVIREAYTEVRGEAEAARLELQQLQDAHKALHEQMTTSLQEAHAVEGGKMRMRLERAERAIEQERATVRDLQRVLAAARQASPAASPRKDGGHARAAQAAAQKELADTRAALEAQKLTNSGLQIRVTELLRTAEEVNQLRRMCEELGNRADTIQSSEDRAEQLEAAVETMRAQNNSLHVTMERLLGTNSELGAKVNSQAAHISTLEALLAEARANGPAKPASVEPAGGVRFSESDLELLALAEYVKELEAALDKQRALSSSQQQRTPATPAQGPTNSKEAGGGSSGSATGASETDGAATTQNQGGVMSSGKPLEESSQQQGKGQVALRSPRKQSVSWWGYITGADRATPSERNS